MNKLPEDCFHLGIKLLLKSGGKILLLEKRHPIRGIYWELPGGRLQKGETVMETLRREMEEETGWQDVDGALPFDMVLTNMRIPTPMGEVGLVLFVYCCEIFSIFSPRLSSEHTNFGWFTFLEAVELLKNQYSEVFIEKIAQMGSPLHFIKDYDLK